MRHQHLVRQMFLGYLIGTRTSVYTSFSRIPGVSFALTITCRVRGGRPRDRTTTRDNVARPKLHPSLVIPEMDD